MINKFKSIIEKYQCIGCISGDNFKCFNNNDVGGGIGCGKHLAGTYITGIGKILLGNPNGFNRAGAQTELKPNIYELMEDYGVYNMWNIPVWKHLTDDGHTLVRGIMPRRNEPFIHIFLEDCISQIECLEISKDDIEGMD